MSLFNKNPKFIGLILLKHGIFTFGDTAKESYDRMINLVSIAENKLKKIPIIQSIFYQTLLLINLTELIIKFYYIYKFI